MRFKGQATRTPQPHPSLYFNDRTFLQISNSYVKKLNGKFLLLSTASRPFTF